MSSRNNSIKGVGHLGAAFESAVIRTHNNAQALGRANDWPETEIEALESQALGTLLGIEAAKKHLL